MFEVVFAIFVIFFFCWGIGEFLHFLRILFFSSKQRGANIIVSFLHEPTALKHTRGIIEKYRWYGTSYADKVFFVYDKLSEKTNKSIFEIIDGEKNIYYCNKETFLHIISRFNEEDNEHSGTVTTS